MRNIHVFDSRHDCDNASWHDKCTVAGTLVHITQSEDRALVMVLVPDVNKHGAEPTDLRIKGTHALKGHAKYTSREFDDERKEFGDEIG